MSYNAAEENLDFTLAVPKTIYPYTTPWDARKIYGCRCDQYYAGHDCSVSNILPLLYVFPFSDRKCIFAFVHVSVVV
jgi:hypothetical protein